MLEMTEKHLQLIERFDPEFRERHVETDHTSQLIAIDTFMVGMRKGIGKLYLKTVIECQNRYALGSL